MIAERRADLKLGKQIEHAVAFFVELAGAFPGLRGLDAVSFHKRIDSSLTRRHLLASRFVAARLDAADGPSRSEAIEARRMKAVISGLPQSVAGHVVRDYAHHLQTSDVSLRTQRLYLHAATAFTSAAPIGLEGWKPLHLLQHLRKVPGQSASLGRFVTYCRRAKGWDVHMPDRSTFAISGSVRTAQQVTALRKALATASATSVDQLTRTQLVAVLSPALGLSKAAICRLAPVVVPGSNAVRLTDDAIIEVKDPLHPFALQWVRLQ